MGEKFRFEWFFIIVFFSICSLLYLIIDANREDKEREYLDFITEKYTVAYRTIYEKHEQIAETLYSGIVNRYDIVELYTSLQSASKEEQSTLRRELLNRIKSRYEELKKIGIRQLHFHLADNTSFLRFHRPEKYGDNLTDVRETVRRVNETHKPQHGFESGRIFSGYRYVFPITSHEGTHLGSFEISFAPAALTSAMMKQYVVLSNFYVNAETLSNIAFKDELFINHKKSHHNDYFFDNEALHELEKVSKKNMKTLKPSKEIVDKSFENAMSGENRSLAAPSTESIITTIPIKTIDGRGIAAFFTIRSEDRYISQLEKSLQKTFILGVILIGLVLYVMYIQKRSNRNLNRSELKFRNVFEKAAIGMSRTTTEGRFIEVNRALCDIVGYSKEELLNMTFIDLTHPSDLEPDLVNMRRLLRGEVSSFSMEKRYITKSKEIIWIRLTTAIVKDSGDIYMISSLENITERKNNLEKLSRISHELALIFNNSLTGVVWVSEGRYVQRANQRAADILGYVNSAELEGMHGLELHLTFERYKDFGERFYSLLERREIRLIEYEFKKKDGSPVSVTVSGRAVDKNTPADLSKGVIWTFDDLSEKKILEQNLIYEKNKFENMFRHHSAIMFIVDPENGRMVDANNAAVEFYQYSYHELISLKIYDINSLSREEIDEKMHKVKQEELKSFIFKHKKKDGSVVYVEGFGSTILVDGKKLLFSIVHDISQRVKDEEDKNRYHRELELLNRNLNERVEAEAQKRVAQELIFKQIFNSLDSFVSLVDRDYRYVIVNEKYSEVFGINEKELVGKHISVVIGEDSFNGKTKALLDRAFSGEVITVDGYSSVDREEGMYVETTFCPYIEDGKEISSVIVSSRDVTERYELKKEIQKKENLMIQQSKLADMGSMIATIAHQWKQPLNILALSAEIYKAEHEDDEDAEVLAAEISAQVKYMADTVNDFRNFFNPTKRKHSFVIMSAVEQIMRMLESKMKTQDIKIEFFGDDGIQAYGFRNEFMQVMVNLIVNARDAITGSSSEGGEISIEILHEDSWAVIKVKDTGGGIPEELLPEKLFESYFTTKGEGGTGIGLSMAKTIIEQYMEGSISASNIEGGAEFIIKLPAEEVKINENIEIINKCILYVEDDEFTLKNVSSLLEKRYKCVIRAENGAEGLELYKKYIDKIGLIVTDIDMPKMNGLEMTKRIRELNSEIPVYAVTSIKEDVYEDIGFSGIIEKPIHLKALYKLLAEAEKGRID